MFFDRYVLFHNMLLPIISNQISFIPCYKLNVSINDELVTVSWLLILFFIIAIVIASVQVYYIFPDVCETMLWMYYSCVLFFFVSSQDLIVGSFLVYLSIFFTLEACIYTCRFIVGLQ